MSHRMKNEAIEGGLQLVQLQEGETITDFFLIREREIKQASNGSDYANFMLERNLEVIPAKLWDITTKRETKA